MSFIETDLGFIKEQEQNLIFFGKNSATIDQIKQAYPDLTFRGIQQKHTDICVASTADSNEIIADAHFTTERKIALIVKTADCQPILIYDKNKNLILAIHAGWRGVENQITSKALLKCEIKQADIFIGPSIQQSSFAVDLDVKELLKNNCKIDPDSKEFLNTFIAKDLKFHIDLSKIVIAEIKASGVDAKISSLAIDTLTDPKFHSYRRDKANSGRNYSFIARL